MSLACLRQKATTMTRHDMMHTSMPRVRYPIFLTCQNFPLRQTVKPAEMHAQVTQ